MNRPSPRSPWPHLQPLPIIPLRGTEGGQIGSSPPRTPPGERERVAFERANERYLNS